MTTFIPSPQQADFFRALETGKGSIVLEAVAGAGKTTTVVEGVTRMKGSVAFVAFNKKIADELGERLKARGSNAVAGTFHSFGFRAWRQVAKNVRVEEKKVLDLLRSIIIGKDEEEFFPLNDGRLVSADPLISPIRTLVSLAKQHAFGFLKPIEDLSAWHELIVHHEIDEELPEGVEVEDVVELSVRILRQSMAQDKQVIDFDDMIFAPLVHGASVFQNDWVIIDEAQDTNPARRALAKKMLRPGGRLIAVGDPCQAIYGFTGADADALDIIRKEFNATSMPLTVTYRCPRAVVEHTHQWVNHIQAHPSAPLGEVKTISQREFLRLTPGKDDAVLCRNTKPLVELAYSLLRRGIPCHVEGRDIGKGLIALVNRFKAKTLESLLEKLDEHVVAQTSKLMAKGQEMAAQSLQDKVDTIVVIASSLNEGATINDLRKKIEGLFEDSQPGRQNRLILSTIHKAKGREWNKVWWLGRNRYQPSPFARQEWQAGQEVNLMYVAATRAKETLIEVEVPKKGESLEEGLAA